MDAERWAKISKNWREVLGARTPPPGGEDLGKNWPQYLERFRASSKSRAERMGAAARDVAEFVVSTPKLVALDVRSAVQLARKWEQFMLPVEAWDDVIRWMDDVDGLVADVELRMQQEPAGEQWMPKSEAAKRAGVTLDQLRGWCRRDTNKLPTKYLAGGHEWVNLVDVERERDAKMLDNRKQPQTANVRASIDVARHVGRNEPL